MGVKELVSEGDGPLTVDLLNERPDKAPPDSTQVACDVLSVGGTEASHGLPLVATLLP